MIAESCHAEITKTLELPRMTPSEQDDLVMLHRLVNEGFTRKVTGAGLPEQAYRARVEEEMALITDKRVAGYFLLEHDLVQACVTGAATAGTPMLLGTGRGPAPPRLIPHLLRLTTLGPPAYDPPPRPVPLPGPTSS